MICIIYYPTNQYKFSKPSGYPKLSNYNIPLEAYFRPKIKTAIIVKVILIKAIMAFTAIVVVVAVVLSVLVVAVVLVLVLFLVLLLLLILVVLMMVDKDDEKKSVSVSIESTLKNQTILRIESNRGNVIYNC